MLLSNSPSKIPLPFANSGTKNNIPTASQIGITPGAASLTDGFPPLTMAPLAAGGVPPYGADFNGVLNRITAIQQWQNAGGGFAYDATFSSAIGGYPLGALVLRADGTGYWFNQADGNTTSPETGGAGWVPLYTAVLPNTLDAGTANAYACVYSPAITVLTDGLVVWFKAITANTGASTIKINALAAVPLVGGAHAALQGGEIIATGKCMCVYNASLSSFVLLECTGGALQVAPASKPNHAPQFSQVQLALGYTPVQQGTGIGQGNNIVKIGWGGNRVKVTVDTTDQGNIVFDSQANATYAPLNGSASNNFDVKPATTGNQAVNISQFSSSLNGAGWKKYPDVNSPTGYFIEQWGSSVQTVNSNSNGSITWPITFPNAVLSNNLTVGDNNTGTSYTCASIVSQLSMTGVGFAASTPGNTQVRINYLAKGY